MNVQNISTAEVEAVRTVVRSQRNSPFLQSRHNRNVLHPPEQLDNETFWKQMVICMCTSLQRSGPNSRVSKLARERPFSLALNTCESQIELRTYAEDTLRGHGLRFGPKIAVQIETNLAWLRKGGWQTTQDLFRTVLNVPIGPSPSTRVAAERLASRTLMGRSGGLAGFGPKQSRNLWQCLGVTQYEIPLDSRICEWINALPSTFRVNPSQLYNSVAYYEDVMSHIQTICEVAEAPVNLMPPFLQVQTMKNGRRTMWFFET